MKSYKTNNNGQYLDSTSHSGLFTIIIMLLIFINMAYLFYNSGNQMSFSSFLNGLSDMPKVDISVVQRFTNSRITGDWSLWLSERLGIGISFNWLRDFLNNFIMPILSLLSFFLAGLVQLVYFITWSLGFIFGGKI